ncbi:MAG: hypothetical protein GF401_19855 [Chitinivibrionales bacterium]|nr:hypothetical protein [Chitinivibrionales bacterium]
MRRLLVFVTPTISFLIGGCILDNDVKTDNGPVTQSTTYIIASTAASDYSSGNVSVISTADYTAATDLLTINGDNTVTAGGGSVYVLERLGADNLIRIDDENISSESLTYQKSLGAAVNIQNIAVVKDTKAYVTQYGSPNCAIINPTTGDVVGAIAINDPLYLSEGETVPYMSEIMVAGGNAYLLIQRLKTVQGAYGPYPDFVDSTGMVVVVSTSTDQIVASIKLSKGNPASLDTCGGYLYVSSTGSWMDQADGGIEKINLSTNTNEGIVVSESLFTGDITTLKIISQEKAYVCNGTTDENFNFSTSLVECNLTAGTVGNAVAGIDDAFGGIAYDGTYLYVGDRSATAPGVIVIDPSDNSTVAGPIDVGALPPNSLALLTLSR